MQYPSPPEQTYRAPAPAAAFGPMAGGTRTVFLVIVSLMGAAFLAAVTTWTIGIAGASSSPSHEPDEGLMTTGAIALGVLLFLLYGQIATGLVWVYRAWSWLPPDQRYTKHWRSWISPSQAALMLLIPYFHYYWMFVANCGLCDALDRLRVMYPTRQAAPKDLAIMASICQLIVPFPVASILWLVFMRRIERMTQEMAAQHR